MQPTKPHKRSIVGVILKYVVPLVISVGLCWLLFHDFDFAQMMQIIREQCNFWWIAGGLAAGVVAHVFRALRWRLQLRALDIHVPLFYLIISIFGTYAVNLVFPRLGEVWRTGYIAQRQHASFTEVFGSMVADRLADTLTVFLILLLALALAAQSIMTYLAQNAELYHKLVGLATSPWVWGFALACIVALWWLFTRRATTGPFARIRRALAGLWQGFVVVLHMPRRGLWLLYTAGIWGCFFLAMWLEFYAFDFSARVAHTYGLTAVLVTFVLSSITMGVPSNGGIGPWQWAVIFALGIYSVPAVESGAMANLIMASLTLLNIALGIFTFIVVAADRRRAPSISNTKNTQNISAE